MKIAFYCTNEFSCPLPKEIVYAPMGLAEKIVKGLEKRGHDITFYTPTDSEIKIKKVDCGMISYYRLKNKAMSGGFHDQLQLPRFPFDAENIAVCKSDKNADHFYFA